MKAFEAKVETIIWRYYLLMAVVIIPFFLGIPLLSLFALPLFLIAILGISFKKEKTSISKSVPTKERSIVPAEFSASISEAS